MLHRHRNMSKLSQYFNMFEKDRARKHRFSRREIASLVIGKTRKGSEIESVPAWARSRNALSKRNHKATTSMMRVVCGFVGSPLLLPLLLALPLLSRGYTCVDAVATEDYNGKPQGLRGNAVNNDVMDPEL